MPKSLAIIVMTYAILRLSKLKTWSNVSGSGAHTYRTITTPNADPSRANLNVTAIGNKGDVLTDVKRRVNDITKKPRKNAVLAIEFLLTASPEFFDGKTQTEIRAWANASTKWLKTQFGKDNVVHVVMHQDEKTPHLVAYVVPEKAGRLNARGIIGNPEMLTHIQTSYAESVASFGLKRGQQGSQAKHQTAKEWYSKLNDAAEAAANVEVVPPSPPPGLGIFMGQKARREAVEAWQASEAAERKKLIQAAAAASLALCDMRHQVDMIKTENSKITDEVINLRRNLSAAYETLGLGKEAITALRTSNTTLVAHRLGYTGPIMPKENAIDLLKRVGGFDYGQAVAWLYAEFGPVVTGAVVGKAAQEADVPRPFTKAENAIKRAVTAQLDALDADRYRLTLISYDESQKPIVPGKRKTNDEEKFYTKSEIIDMIPWLKFQNNQGMNVLITPMDDVAYYILLDDSRLSASQLEQRGFKPCIIQESSWSSTQVVFKVPKTMDRDAVMSVFSSLNTEYGDAKITGLRHPFRVPGFRNMKPKHLREGTYPFVKVLSAVNTMCQRCMNLVRNCDNSQVINISTGTKYK